MSVKQYLTIVDFEKYSISVVQSQYTRFIKALESWGVDRPEGN